MKWDRFGLVLFVMGCFGMLQIELGINSDVLSFIAIPMIVAGALLFTFAKGGN